MTCSQPSSRNKFARFSLDTTPIGVPPPFRTYCVAYAPMPPVAPHTSTACPCVIWDPLGDTIMRYDVLLHSALHAASSHVRCAGFGINWFAFTTEMSARPPKLVSKPQMRWFVAIIESSCADGSWSSTCRQCTVTTSPGFQLRTAEPTRNTTPDASEPMTWYG